MGIYDKVKYFDNIPAVPRKDMILARLGYKKTATTLDNRYIFMVDAAIKRGNLLCRPSGAYMRLKVIERNGFSVRLENGVEFQSKSLSNLLKDSRELILMASTVGNEVVEMIFNEVDNGNAAIGVILDSVASQTADAALDWIVHLLDRMLVREGKKLTRHRYSPGFGDLPLSYQKDIFDALQLDRLNMELTKKFMLVPEKSVIAIAGVDEKGS